MSNGLSTEAEAYRQHLISNGLAAEAADQVVNHMVASGSVPAVTVAAESPHAKPREKGKLEKACTAITATQPASRDLAFMHTILCQLGLPRRAVAGERYERVCDGVGLQLQAGSLFDGERYVDQPIPYGAMPRMVLAHLNTQALRQQSPIVDVGPSASAFLRSLGFDPNGGARGPYTMFKKQVQALAACRITMGFSVGDSAYTIKGDLIDEFEAWTQPSSTGRGRDLWPQTITFSQRYYDSLREHAVPLDLRALHALKGSALALDLYAMLAERLHRISSKRVMLHWASLRAQFGHDYTGDNATRNFKRDFIAALKKVQAVYPKAAVSVVNTGVLMKPSPPPIPYRAPR